MVRVIDMVGIIDPVVAHRPVANFGHGTAGHEKWATVAEILAQRPTYIQYGFLKDNYWQDGYYFDTTMRIDLQRRIEGIWRRDELSDSGSYLPAVTLHFNPSDVPTFTVSGTAFESWPTSSVPSHQSYPTGAIGYFVDTFSEAAGDGATGQLFSSKFTLVGDKMVLRVGGGFDAERLRVSLWVNDQRVFSATGADSDFLSRREWPIERYRGMQAAIEIVDDATGPWGHIVVDEIEQWRRD
jgi:hypothetical protein